MTWPPLTLFTDQSAASACRQRLAKMGSVIEAALMVCFQTWCILTLTRIYLQTDAAPLHRAQIDTVFYRLLLSVAAKERERVGDSDDVEQLLQVGCGGVFCFTFLEILLNVRILLWYSRLASKYLVV
jgi:hypothetical protein